jgi:dCTP diphosphatase
MSDSHTSVAELRGLVGAFTAERDWQPYHNAKDLAISIAIEAAELMEEFQWRDAAEVAEVCADPESRERVRQELADVLIYCLSLSNAVGIDVSGAVRDKLNLAAAKYPVQDYKGRAHKPGVRSAPHE